jgi:GntR family transcriptional regulator
MAACYIGSKRGRRCRNRQRTNYCPGAQKYFAAGLVFDSRLSIHCIHSMYSGINISQTDARPMYLQIMEQIRARIAAGDWSAGKELPSIRALAAALSVSVITIKRAYLDLENEGVIMTRHGKGSFVADVTGLAGELQEEKLDEHLAAAAGIGQLLGISEDELATRLRRAIRNVDKR